ncbi:MAG TPA: hypothetical protein VLL56_10500, partial [Terriglobia bacterium]|nr:hypothetical protein [Terriglobia bacterium]
SAMIRDPAGGNCAASCVRIHLASDIETKQELRLFAEDGLSTASWPHDILAAMTAAAQSPSGELPSNRKCSES